MSYGVIPQLRASLQNAAGVFGGLLAFENSAGVDAEQTVRVRKTASVAHQSAGCGETTHKGNRRNRMLRRQCGNLPAPAREERIAADQERPCAQLGNGYKDRIEVAFGAGTQYAVAAQACGRLPAGLSIASRNWG